MVSDGEVAALVEVARSAGTDLSRDKQSLLPGLIERGYVAPASGGDGIHPRYRLTASGQAILDERGVGANES